jgi:hypothetical protein
MEEKLKQIQELEEELSYSNEEDILPPSDIVAFNELRSCADLFRLYEKRQLQLQPEFQRNFVWSLSAQTRFIDSLIKQLPIPSLCIGLDYKTERRIVIDGLQRISTIVKFLEDMKWRLSRLSDVDEKIAGKSVAEIKNSNNNLYERIENCTIPVTVLRCDFSKQNHMDYLFTIFHRLNTGGQKLNNQEIRNCIYSGNFNNMLKEIAKSPQWKEIFGETPEIDRLNDEELLLRTFAFNDELDMYTGNLAKFLNHYMKKKQDVSESEIKEKRDMLFSSLSFLTKIDNTDSIRQLNKTLKEGLLVGVSKNITRLMCISKEDAIVRFERFKCNTEFSEDNIRQGLSAKEKVQSRLRTSISIFGE